MSFNNRKPMTHEENNVTQILGNRQAHRGAWANEVCFKVARYEGSCCRDMLQRHVAATKTCVVHTEATCSGDV